VDVSPGPIALAGSGEFLPVMEPVDRQLLQGRSPRAAFLPTAAAREGDERVRYWLELGDVHYRHMGVEPVPVPVRDRDDAEDPELAARLDGVGLIYLSGGDPHHLTATLRHTRVWNAILAAWHGGAALAGCSAGAMALTSGAPALDGRSAGGVPDGHPNGLGVMPGLAVIPHFDVIGQWRPQAMAHYARWQPPGTTLLGIDEETALVGDGPSWRVAGRRSVWVLSGGERVEAKAGERLTL